DESHAGCACAHTEEADSRQAVQRVATGTSCRYEPGERARSHTEAGILPEDVIRLAPDRLLLADFGAGWRHPKHNATDDPTLQGWLRGWDADDTYRLSV